MNNSWNPNLSKTNAVALANSKFYENLTPEQIAIFQLFQSRLCMPFGVFHKAVDKFVPGVSTIGFGLMVDELQNEVRGSKGPPTLEEILSFMPDHLKALCSEGAPKTIQVVGEEVK